MIPLGIYVDILSVSSPMRQPWRHSSRAPYPEGGLQDETGGMDTPWGRLADLDATDRDLAFRILGHDKHQVLEGLVVENTFDQILRPLEVGESPRLKRLEIETVIVDARRKTGNWLALVWARKATTGLGRYLLALEKVARVHLVEFLEGEFLATACSGAKRASGPVPIQDLLGSISGRRPIFSDVDLTVRDVDRQRAAFWGYLSDTYRGDRLWNEVVLSRLFINFGVQPFFRGVWNLDRICLCDGRLWMLEAKHKYPFGGRTLKFGINDGELEMMRLAGEAGIGTVYALIVKPEWSRKVGSMYLHGNLEMRRRAAVIGKVMDAAAVASTERDAPGRSPAHTSITGRGSLSYRSIPATGFALLGGFADGPESLSESLLHLLQGREMQSVSDEMLRQLSHQV
jgi:hypothetical protein